METKTIEMLDNTHFAEMGLYDSGTAAQTSVTPYRVIDVTAHCPKAVQVVIKYAKVNRGLIAQLNSLYEKNVDLGVTVHWHINEITAYNLATDVVFERQCSIMGATPLKLATVIFENK